MMKRHYPASDLRTLCGREAKFFDAARTRAAYASAANREGMCKACAKLLPALATATKQEQER